MKKLECHCEPSLPKRYHHVVQPATVSKTKYRAGAEATA